CAALPYRSPGFKDRAEERIGRGDAFVNRAPKRCIGAGGELHAVHWPPAPDALKLPASASRVSSFNANVPGRPHAAMGGNTRDVHQRRTAEEQALRPPHRVEPDRAEESLA